MSKYIDIDKDELWERLKKAMLRHIVTNTLFNTIKAVIDGLPTIDIVHCEQCEHWGEDYGTCDFFDYPTEYNCWCCFGERINNE